MATLPAAAVIGLGSLPGLPAARILADRGVPFFAVFCDPGHSNCRTNVCRDIRLAPDGPEQLLEHLVSIGKSLDEPGVLVPCRNAVWPRRDPVPFFADLWRVFRVALSPTERRKRRILA